MVVLVGADEAGRGAVIGPLVLCGVVVNNEEKVDQLMKVGVKDSKLLSPERRKELFKEVMDIVDDYMVCKISAKEIDSRKSVGTKLNKLEAINIARILDELKPDKAILDSPKGPDSFTNMIIDNMNGMKDKVNIVAKYKADSRYPIVSASSIIAKVIRDREVKELGSRLGLEVGSGYPGDPKTKELLENLIENQQNLPQWVRKSWGTVKRIKKQKNQKSITDF